MQANYVQRLRLTFSKTGPTRFISHLDLARALERTLNRARIPIAYSQGFNPRPRMQLAAALPLGYTSCCELADIWLTEAIAPEQVRQRIMAKVAPGIIVHEVAEVPLSEAALQTQTVSATYTARLLDPVNAGQLQQQIEVMLAAKTIIRQRSRGKNRKPYDLRSQIIDLHLELDEDAFVNLVMHLYLMPGRTGRPDELLLALGLDPLAARIRRSEIMLAAEKSAASG
jgi:radical SAM-linked protein